MKKSHKEILLYGIVGVVGAGVDTLVFWLLLQTALPLIIVQWFAALAGSTHNHLWHHFKVFDHDQGLRRTYFLGMSLAIVLVLLSGPLLAGLQAVIGVLWISKGLTIIVTAVISFIVRKFFIFRRKKTLYEKSEDVIESVLKKEHMEKAIFAAGCFWGVEDDFKKVPGVLETTVGYTGGDLENPTYEKVCNHDTGHAEAVEVVYDPEKVSFKELVETFWELHDPTQVNRQGPDVGRQYRSAIFYNSPEQERIAQESKAALEKEGTFKAPVATEIVSATTFYPAEDYHQDYVEKHGGVKVC